VFAALLSVAFTQLLRVKIAEVRFVGGSYCFSYFPIICSLKIAKSPTATITKYLTRAIRAINITELCHDIPSSRPITRPPSALSDVVDCYNSTFCQVLNKHALPSLKSSTLKLAILGVLRH